MTAGRAVRVALIGGRGLRSTYGGFETFLRHLAPALVDEGFDVTVYGRAEGPARTKVIEHSPTLREVITGGVSEVRTTTLSHGATAFWHAQKEGYEVVVVVNIANAFFLPMLRNSRTIVCCDGIEWEREKWKGMGARVFKRAARLTVERADKIVADAVAIKERWEAEFGVEAVFIPYGADESNYPPADLTTVGIDRPYALVICRMVPENNVETILDSFTDLADLPVQLVVVGTGSPEFEQVPRLSELSDTQDNLIWLGHVPDQHLLRTLWAQSTVYVHGHSAGGTNPALLQAMQEGCPVLAFGSVYAREVLGEDYPIPIWTSREELTARLRAAFEPGGIEGADAVEELQRRRISEMYNWKTVVGSYTEIIHELSE